jgi:hypothetical protein
MSHFTVLVTGENCHEALAPFIEQQEEGYEQYFTFQVEATAAELQKEWEKHKASDSEYQYETLEEYASEYCGHDRNENGDYGRVRNPNAKWDWYELGGRWSGLLKLYKGATGLKGGRYHVGNIDETGGYVDAAFMRDIDWDTMRAEEKKKGLEYITPFFKAIVNQPIPEEWHTIRERHGENHGLARETYHAQPAIKAAKKAKDDFWFTLDEALNICPSYKEIRKESVFTQEAVSKLIEEYAQSRANTAGHTFAVLHDGKWLERGEMGWFGVVSDEKDHDDWAQSFTNFLNSLPPDTFISIVDCHI